MGSCCGKSNATAGATESALDAATSDRQAQVLKATPGTLLASARIRRGDILDCYTFESKVVGTGFSGPVRLAVDKQTGRRYAIKPFGKLGANKDKVNMLRNECQIYLRLDHPHIARLIEIWESLHHVYIVMEYCSGGELYERLCAKKAYSEVSARNAVRQMCSAISYLHSHDIVHRDMKLENWLFQDCNENADLKLIDFGFSKIWSSRSKRMHATCGTLVYVSPDTLLGGYTNGCDMWSLGVIVYMLLVGYPPFFGSEEEMFSRILEAQYSLTGPRWDHISATGKDFVRRLLQKEPSKRLTAIEALQHPWLAPLVEPIQKSLDPAVIESFRRFACRSKFQRAALNLMALSLTSSQVQGMVSIFMNLDRTFEGTIRLRELQEALQQDLPTKEIDKIFKSLDNSGDQQIYYSDFLAAMLTHKLSIDRDLLRHSFLKFDRDRSGFLSFDNIRDVLGDSYSFKALVRLFCEADRDGNGLIDYQEFVRLVAGEEDEILDSPRMKEILPPTTDTTPVKQTSQSERNSE